MLKGMVKVINDCISQCMMKFKFSIREINFTFVSIFFPILVMNYIK